MFPALLLTATVSPAQPTAQKATAPPPPTQTEEPPEEDATFLPKEYTFNPLQATKEISTGRFYMHKGNWKGARNRFLEATKWNPGSAEAFFLLGEAQEKMNDKKAAKEAYQKYLELEPTGKEATTAKKKLAKL